MTRGSAADGALVLLEDQDRSRWDRAEIAEGLALVNEGYRRLAGAGRPAGPYLLQASIAGVHARAATPAATGWPVIARLYGALAAVAPSPVVELNRAVAISFAEGPLAGLARLDSLGAEPLLRDYHLFHAARADLLRRVGRRAEAAEAYRRALALAGTEVERTYLAGRLAEVRGDA